MKKLTACIGPLLAVGVVVASLPLSYANDAQSSSTTGTPPTEIYRANQGVSAPTLIYKVEPEYTETALKSRVEGTVVLYGEVGSDGRVRNFRVIQGLGYGLDDSAIETVSK